MNHQCHIFDVWIIHMIWITHILRCVYISCWIINATGLSYFRQIFRKIQHHLIIKKIINYKCEEKGSIIAPKKCQERHHPQILSIKFYLQGKCDSPWQAWRKDSLYLFVVINIPDRVLVSNGSHTMATVSPWRSMVQRIKRSMIVGHNSQARFSATIIRRTISVKPRRACSLWENVDIHDWLNWDNMSRGCTLVANVPFSYPLFHACSSHVHRRF